MKHKKIGLIADSHSKLALMEEAVLMLKRLGAETIIHLGDICDSLVPQSMDEAVTVLNRYHVKAVLGNNEYMLNTEYLSNNPHGVKKSTRSYFSSLPYFIIMGDICFTHSLPYDWPAATRRPIKEYIPNLLIQGACPYRIIFRGHSHRPSVIESVKGHIEEYRLKPDVTLSLKNDHNYIITVGAVEYRGCALFDPGKEEVSFISLK